MGARGLRNQLFVSFHGISECQAMAALLVRHESVSQDQSKPFQAEVELITVSAVTY